MIVVTTHSGFSATSATFCAEGGRKEKMNAKKHTLYSRMDSQYRGALMLLPVATAVFYREEEGIAYALVVAVCAAVGALLTYKKPKIRVFTRRKALSAPRWAGF